MGYAERKLLFDRYETMRKKPLITFVTSIRLNISSQMAGDSISEIIEQIQAIPIENTEIDFLIISNGGDPITALRIITLLRERFKRITVVVPNVAYSAATILALGADDIIMHPFSNLGPVDPQLTIVKQNEVGAQSNMRFGSEDIRNYIDFVRNDVGITDQGHLLNAFMPLTTEIGTLPIGSSKRSQQLSLNLSIKMLETHMKDKNKASSIAKVLNSSYYHHGYAVGRREAKEIGLNVVFPEKELEDTIWNLWEDYCIEMKCNTEFNPVTELMSDPVARGFVLNHPVITIPMNTPPQVAQTLMAQAATQSMQVTQQSAIELTSTIAAIESIRKAYSFKTKSCISYWRDINMQLGLNVVNYPEGWKEIQYGA